MREFIKIALGTLILFGSFKAFSYVDTRIDCKTSSPIMVNLETQSDCYISSMAKPNGSYDPQTFDFDFGSISSESVFNYRNIVFYYRPQGASDTEVDLKSENASSWLWVNPNDTQRTVPMAIFT